MKKITRLICAVSCVGTLLGGALAAHSLTLEWVAVRDPGNVADDTGYGAVADAFLIGEKEITNEQYAEFLNKVAATDTYGLYHGNMANPSELYQGGITQDCSSGPCTYSTITDREDKPVVWVSFNDAARFVNWLHNGQPTGAQDSTTTEDGTYNMSLGDSVFRKDGATLFLPSEDEWYKAAFFNGTSYFDYPTGTNTTPTCEATPGGTNSANCNPFPASKSTEFGTTEVGGYTSSPSPYGTFDQGGNVWDWTEAWSGSYRVLRGGSHHDRVEFLKVDHRGLASADEDFHIGFRVAMIPEPGTGLLLMTGLAGLALRRRLSA